MVGVGSSPWYLPAMVAWCGVISRARSNVRDYVSCSVKCFRVPVCVVEGATVMSSRALQFQPSDSQDHQTPVESESIADHSPAAVAAAARSAASLGGPVSSTMLAKSPVTSGPR